jgi:PrgI family protein
VSSQMVRIPADVDRPDRVIANLTARQLVILAVTGMLLYALWGATRHLIPVAAFLVVAIPIGATAAILALGQRDGISLDRLLLAAVRQQLQPRVRIAAPEGVRPAPEWLTAAAATSVAGPGAGHERGRRQRRPGTGARAIRGTAAGEDISPSPLRLPTEAVTDTGVLDLGADGLAVIAACSTVNFALRTASEQEALVASFGRYLHSLTAPVQILVRAERLDLSGQIADLRAAAGGLPHPALEAAAQEHADYLTQLAGQTDLLRRQVLLILREPLAPAGPADGLGGPSPAAMLAGLVGRRRSRRDRTRIPAAARRAAEARLVRRLGEAIDLLAPAAITATPLDAARATAVLAAACNPDSLIPPSAGLAGADEVITGHTGVVTTPPDAGFGVNSGEDVEPHWTAEWSAYPTSPGDRRSAGNPGDTDLSDWNDNEFGEEGSA